ncbi:MAG: LamG domain-containing protein [Candidatus Undinarchaeales archaeon]|jgi:hypothetical protein|nr:LamG domain-containing protein [Candidatus Undinarchaeales archaeon]MDP7493873.1 LamG domain-containing protein [Candidatus Undinarchaeales archaeon]
MSSGRYIRPVVVLLLLIALAAADVWETDDKESFDEGTYSSTLWSTDHVQLTSGGSGTYTSKVFDAQTDSQWQSIAWERGAPYDKPFPDNRGIETMRGGADMTGNVLLLHLDETGGAPQDASGQGNHGTASGGPTYEAEGRFGTGIQFGGWDDVVTIADAASLDITDAITIEAFVKLGPEWEHPDSVAGGLEFDTSAGSWADIIHVDGDVYAIAYRGASADKGYVKTVSIADDGPIGNKALGTKEFDGHGDQPVLIHVTGDIYAIAFSKFDNQDGKIKTVSISPTGTIGSKVLGDLKFADTGLDPDIVHVKGTVYAVVYRTDNDAGVLETVTISADGTGVAKTGSSLEFDGTKGYEPRISHVDGTVFAIVYRGDNDCGYLKTVSIDKKGTIGAVIDTLSINTDAEGTCYKVYEPVIVNVAGNVFAIAYRGDSDHGEIRTVSIADNGQIGDETLALLQFASDSQKGYEPDIVHIDHDLFALVYSNHNTYGVVKMVSIGEDGTSGLAVINSNQFEGTFARRPVIVPVTDTVFAIAYRGPNDDGFLQTVWLAPDRGIVKPGAYALTIDSDSVVGRINRQKISTTLSSGWYHVALTYDRTAPAGAQQKIYVNGQMQKSKELTGAIVTNSYDLFVGRYDTNTFDEVAIYDRALSAAEIQDHYARGFLELTPKVRSCDDPSCTGEEFTTIAITSPQAPGVADNRYFQYRFDLSTPHTSSPDLYGVTVTYLQGTMCGDGSCDDGTGEDHASCPQDCCEADGTAEGDTECHAECNGQNGASVSTQCDGLDVGGGAICSATEGTCSSTCGYTACPGCSDCSGGACTADDSSECEGSANSCSCVGGTCVTCSGGEFCATVPPQCTACPAVCDAICLSSECFGTDPDCNEAGEAALVCCGNGKCEAGEDCGTCLLDCPCQAGYQCIGGSCLLRDGQTCTDGGQCASGLCIDKTGAGGQCGACHPGEDNGNPATDNMGQSGVCCVGQLCADVCRDSDGDSLVDTCSSCAGMETGRLCYTGDGEGACCNDLCYVTKLPNGADCAKGCECAAGFCDSNTNTCTDLAGEGAACASDTDCQDGLSCIDTDGTGGLDTCSTCSNHATKQCQEGIQAGYCCGGECAGMLIFDWTPGVACGEAPCDGIVACATGSWQCSSAGRAACSQDKSSTCSLTGVFNAAQAKLCAPYRCDDASGECLTGCVSNEQCLAPAACIDVDGDRAPDSCSGCVEHEASVCDLDGATGFCCGDSCQGMPLPAWTPSNACGAGNCTGAVTCRDGSWACDSLDDPVCSDDLARRGQCSTTGTFESRGDCSPYRCDPSAGQCREGCTSSGDCQDLFPCLDTDGIGGLDRCASCAAFGAAACEHGSTAGYCCGTGCQSMPDLLWTPRGACGTEPCPGGLVACQSNEWQCDIAGSDVCNDERTMTSTCTGLGAFDGTTAQECGDYVCDGTVGTCMSGCSSETHCASQCCVAGACVPIQTKGAGDLCTKDCECGGELVCDPGSGTCSQAVTCPNGQVDNCGEAAPMCVDDPNKDWLCKGSCEPDHAPCVTASGSGFCCSGQCVAPPPGFEPGKACGSAGCAGEVRCAQDTAQLACSSLAQPCCSGNAPGACSEVGECSATAPGCADECGGTDGRTYLNSTCSAGVCNVTESSCGDLDLQCNSERGCVSCLEDGHCEDTCQRYSFLDYSCSDMRCEIQVENIHDCSATGINQVCQLPSGCLSCISNEQCQSQYGPNYACDIEGLFCKVASCFRNENCRYSCEHNVFSGQGCDNYVCKERPSTNCTESGAVCSREGCVGCTADINCTASFTYGSAFGCRDGKCQRLCGNGVCDPSENCGRCLQDCGCQEGETCDPSSDKPKGCAPDFDGDGFGDDTDPCPRDPKNACKSCANDDDCAGLCHQNAHITFSCVEGVCTPGLERACTSEGLVCEPSVGCARCGNMTEPDTACRTAFEVTFICADDACLSDRDLDGIPDDEDPCPSDPHNACTAECPNSVCEATEDCNTCPEDCGCDDGNPCTEDKCFGGQCIPEMRSCGSVCELGVCDGAGGCVLRGAGGDSCTCEGMCEKGFTCDASDRCATAECGDGKCQNECGQCPADCSILDCRGNGVCDTALGEDCILAPKDCLCMLGFICDSSRAGANEIGCNRVTCGDGQCDSPDEGSSSCCEDCGCPSTMTCDLESHSCRGGCGDGTCENATECVTCALDCGPDQCVDDTCEPGVGEDCRTSPDCVCSADIEGPGSLEMVEQETRLLAFTVKNTGSLREAFDISLKADTKAIGLSWTARHKVVIDEDATLPLSVDVQGVVPGEHELTIKVLPVGMPNATIEHKVTVEVGAVAVIDKIGELANIKDFIEVLVIIGALALALKRQVFPGMGIDKATGAAAMDGYQQGQQQFYGPQQQYYGGSQYYGQRAYYGAQTVHSPQIQSQQQQQQHGWGPSGQQPASDQGAQQAAHGLHPGAMGQPQVPQPPQAPQQPPDTTGGKPKKKDEGEDKGLHGFHP